jgi:hypothetical protein
MEQKYRKWVRWIDTICTDVGHLCLQKYVFLQVQAIIDANPQLRCSSEFYVLLNHGYTALGAMGVRRQVKTQNGSISLARLLKDIQCNPQIMSLERYKLLFCKAGIAEELVEKDFEPFQSPSAEHIDPHMVARDLVLLQKSARSCEEFADRRLAHIDPRNVLPFPTFDDLHKCIDLIEELALKYRVLLTAKGGNGLTPSIGYNWKKIFRVPWIEEDT